MNHTVFIQAQFRVYHADLDVLGPWISKNKNPGIDPKPNWEVLTVSVLYAQ